MKHPQIKTSKSLVRDGQALVDEFMRTSFFLPSDIIGDKDWEVQPIRLMSGEQFKQFCAEGDFGTLYCQEDYKLLIRANRVGVSIRRNKELSRTFVVAKLWYGKEPK